MKRKYILLFALILLLIALYFNFKEEEITGSIVINLPSEENESINVYFCPSENCFLPFLEAVKNSEKAECAFFDINDFELIEILKEKKNTRIFVDRNEDAANLSFVRIDNKEAYMHNKFCVLDDSIITGSLNPTITDINRNNNNYLIIKSKYLLENYANEFNEIWNYENISRNVNYPSFYLNGNKIENYFCPEDLCEDKVYNILEKANESIYFMTYSFTSDRLGNLILNKNITKKGVFDRSQAGSKYSEYWRLQNFSVLDANKGLMHHKVFIIDEKIVVTGSYNPTMNGNENNDENILIIHDEKIAEKYLDEFERVYNL